MQHGVQVKYIIAYNRTAVQCSTTMQESTLDVYTAWYSTDNVIQHGAYELWAMPCSLAAGTNIILWC